jgi:hypothetical protein
MQPSHLHPEWGLLVPPRSVARTVRVLMIAAAVGVTAGAGIMTSLAERSSEAPPVVVTRTLVQPAPAVATPPGAQAKPQKPAQSESAKATAASAARTQSAAASLPGAQNQKKANKKHHAGARNAERGRQFSLMDDWYHAVGL